MQPHEFMQRAIDIARPHRTHPNPKVGCVIVRDGVIVGEGAHQHDGGPHAEANALAAAGDAADGSTAYVTLEPCNHYGRTPACAVLLIEAGITEVVVGALDPDQRVSGAGVRRLQDAGISVEVGLLEAESVELDRAYHHQRLSGRPYVVGLVDPPQPLDLDVVEVELDPTGDLMAQVAALDGVVAAAVTDPSTIEALRASDLLDELVICGDRGAGVYIPGFVTVAGADSIEGCTVARKAEDVHGNH